MIGKIDYSGFYKFLASIGLSLMGVAIVGPWIYLQSLETLSVPADDLDGLTEVGRLGLEQRQQIVASSLPWVMVGAVVLLIVGVLLLVYGLIKWSEQQARSDESEQIDLDQKRAALVPASAVDIEAGKEEDARQALSEPDADVSQSSAPSPVPMSARTADHAALVQTIRMAEDTGSRLISSLLGTDFEVSRNVRVADRPYILDAVFTPRAETSYGQLGVDFRVVSSQKNLVNGALDSMQRVALGTWPLSTGNVYVGQVGRPPRASATGVTFILVRELNSNTVADWSALSRLSAAVQNFNEVLKRPVGVVVVPFDRFIDLNPEELRTALTTVWQSGGLYLLGPAGRGPGRA